MKQAINQREIYKNRRIIVMNFIENCEDSKGQQFQRSLLKSQFDTSTSRSKPQNAQQTQCSTMRRIFQIKFQKHSFK